MFQDFAHIAIFKMADLVAYVLGGILYIGYFLGSLALSIYVGKIVYDHINVPVVRLVIAIILGVWINMVMYAAQVPTAVTFIRAAEMSELD
ncbi:hypothetical protein [Martelella mangrovi]|uniref:Uncharacterized protein n=1 Tax=Martelella mangrovi TaxID=1397477 RepID=A0ABV2IDR3_9HYPH